VRPKKLSAASFGNTFFRGISSWGKVSWAQCH
jgi:hypothetical protein